ncbi:hypothetical protein HY345_02490 [Candidatus Microgenomates bacterium]|nr:hypothetical protein [Candidatus Microgenomates bacterium]
MKNFFSFIIVILLIVIYPTVVIAKESASDICLNGKINKNAYELPVSKSADLQKALATYKVVRLEKGDYSKSLSQITLSSNQQLYGFAGNGIPGDVVEGTIVPKIVIPGGTSQVVLSGIKTSNIEFSPSDQVTSGNCFMRLNSYQGRIVADGAKLENNIFLRVNIPFFADLKSHGYLRNNRFIGTTLVNCHPASGEYLCLDIKGDTSRKSGGNVWLWLNNLAPWGNAIYLENLADANFVLFDVENWSWTQKATQAMFKTGPMGSVRILAAEGGQYESNPIKTGFFDIAAEEINFYDFTDNGGSAADPRLVFQKENKRSSQIHFNRNFSTDDRAENPVRLKTLFGGGCCQDIMVNDNNALTSALTAQQQAALKQIFLPTNQATVVWERPSFSDKIANPAGENWQTERKTKTDSTTYLQNLINTNNIARLPAGVYYISQPLKLKRGQGIIGAGEDKTAIVAKNSDIDILRGDEGKSVSWEITDENNFYDTFYTLSDITLQGGKNGLHMDEHGSGNVTRFDFGGFSHVTFRDMTEAGIFIDGIGSWDNNFHDNLTFYNNSVGVKQRNSPNSKTFVGLGHIDKNIFFHSRFIANGRGIDFKSRRANVANGFINSLFKDNTVQAVDTTSTGRVIYANTDFINNAGNPTIKAGDTLTSFVNAYFRADEKGQTMLDNGVEVEGSIFERGTSQTATIMRGGWGTFYNNKSQDMPMGALDQGLVINNSFPLDSVLNTPGVFIKDGKATIFLSGQTDPKPQLLVSISDSTKPGDANGDNVVDGVDYVIWLNHYNQTTNKGVSEGDFNKDNKVDGLDYVIWVNNTK